MPEKSQKRQVAVKLRVSDILSGRYVVEEGWNPNYVLTKDGRKASRVNLLGVVISNPSVEVNYRSAMLDDGSGNISVRSFDETDMFQGISLGDAVFVIGRPRQYGNEIYIMPEIVKNVKNKIWIEVRKKELEKLSGNAAAINPANPAASTAENEPQPFHSASEEVVGDGIAEDNTEETKQEDQSPQQRIYSLIKELDNGEGALFEEILEKSGLAGAETIISRLLMEGEIFEIGKGKLKVLE
jgi:RPA family protein